MPQDYQYPVPFSVQETATATNSAKVPPFEEFGKLLLGPFSVLFRQSSVPPIEQVELDGNNVPLSLRRELVVELTHRLRMKSNQKHG